MGGPTEWEWEGWLGGRCPPGLPQWLAVGAVKPPPTQFPCRNTSRCSKSIVPTLGYVHSGGMNCVLGTSASRTDGRISKHTIPSKHTFYLSFKRRFPSIKSYFPISQVFRIVTDFFETNGTNFKYQAININNPPLRSRSGQNLREKKGVHYFFCEISEKKGVHYCFCEIFWPIWAPVLDRFWTVFRAFPP